LRLQICRLTFLEEFVTTSQLSDRATPTVTLGIYAQAIDDSKRQAQEGAESIGLSAESTSAA